MRLRGAVVVVAVLLVAASVAVLVSQRPAVTLARRELANVPLRLDPEIGPAVEAPIGLPVPLDPAVRHLGDEHPSIRLAVWGESVTATLQLDALSSMMFRRSCLVDGVSATCTDHALDDRLFCGTAPIEAPLVSVDPERFTRWHFMGSGPGWLRDRITQAPEERLDTPYREDAAMALDEGVLLVADDASGHLLAHRLPRRWPTTLDAGFDLGPTRMREAFGRCDLGGARALYAPSGEVLLGHGRTWSHFETKHDAALGIWSCTPDALQRIDYLRRAHALQVISCGEHRCEASSVPLPPEFAGARELVAAHLGTSLAVLFTDASGTLRLARRDAAGFSPSRVVPGAHWPSDRRASVLVHRGRFFASLETLGGTALLVIDASGEASWVRSSDGAPAVFGDTGPEAGVDLLGLDDEVAFLESRLDAGIRLLQLDPATGEGRVCTHPGSAASHPALSCGSRTRAPSPPMLEPGAPADLRDLSVEATVFAEGRTLDVSEDRTAVIERRDDESTGCITPRWSGASLAARAMRFIPDQALALSEDGHRVLAFGLPSALPTRTHPIDEGGCEHTVEGAPLAALPDAADQLTVCPLDDALAWYAWSRVGHEAIPRSIGIGDASHWEVATLSGAPRSTFGCLGDGVSLLSVAHDRVSARRCDTRGCTEASASIPDLLPSALAVDLGDRIALLEVRADQTLVGRFGRLEDLSSAPAVVLVERASAFVPLGTAAVAERPGMAFILGRTSRGIGVLRVGSDERGASVVYYGAHGTFRLGTPEVIP